MPTVADQLDFVAGIGQRQASYVFRLIDAASGRPLGDLHPSMSAPPQLSHDSARKVCRTLTGLVLDKADTAEVNALTMRVTVAMPVAGVEQPLGTYVFTDSVVSRLSDGRRATPGLADLGIVIAQPTSQTVSYPAGASVGTAIASLLGSVDGIGDFTVAATATALTAPIAWPAGTDRGRILEDLCRLGAFFSPFMGNDSVIRVIKAFDPAAEPPDFELDLDTRIIMGTISEHDDLLDAPNRFIVVDNATTAAPVVGVYDVPVTAPHSAANRGFVIPAVFDIQSLGLTGSANDIARAIGLRQLVSERVSFGTVPDPRHDAYNVVRYDGKNWLETSWSLNLIEGAEMDHTLQRAYDPDLPA